MSNHANMMVIVGYFCRQREQLAPIAQKLSHKAMLLSGFLWGNTPGVSKDLQNDVLPLDV